jgi:hypothetical protein
MAVRLDNLSRRKLSRRKALGILGLASMVAYAAPSALSLSTAEAGWRTDRRRRITDRRRFFFRSPTRRRTDRRRRITDRRRFY